MRIDVPATRKALIAAGAADHRAETGYAWEGEPVACWRVDVYENRDYITGKPTGGTREKMTVGIAYPDPDGVLTGHLNDVTIRDDGVSISSSPQTKDALAAVAKAFEFLAEHIVEDGRCGDGQAIG